MDVEWASRPLWRGHPARAPSHIVCSGDGPPCGSGTLPPQRARRPRYRPLPQLSLELGKASVEDFERHIRVLPLDDQGWHQAHGALAAAQDEQALMERPLDDLLARLRVRLTGVLVLDQLDSDHQAAPPHLAYKGVLMWPVRKPAHDVFSHARGVRNILFFQQANSFQRRRASHWVPSESGGMRTRTPIHQLRAGYRHAEWQA